MKAKKRARQLSLGLGLFSIGLGLVEVLAPRSVARFLGVSREHAGLLRAFGAREIATGLFILAQPKNAAGLWGRVAGDAADLAVLANDLRISVKKKNAAAALGAVAAVTAVDVAGAVALSR